VTLCTKDRECLFGDIVDGGMRLNDVGEMIHITWNDLSVKNPGIETDKFVVMPNHVHGIILVVGAPLVGAHSSGAIDNAGNWAGTRPAPTLGDVVGKFKSITTHQYIDGVGQKDWPLFNSKLWQRNYYEHIIRNENALDRIRKYIIENPMKWAEDENNPANIIRRRGEQPFAP
jgi:putative transposase